MAGIFREYDLPKFDTENIIFVKVGTDSLSAGNVVVANDVVGTYLDGQGALYTPVQVSDIANGNLAIVAPDEYYHDSDGNRLNIDDPTKKVFTTGDRIKAIRPVVGKHYFVSSDLITGTAAAGKYLIPTKDAYGWTVTTDISTGTPKFVLYIEEINVKDTFVGLAAVTGVRVRVVRADAV